MKLILIREVKIVDPINFPSWVVILGNFGFPITIAILFHFEKKIENLTGVIDQLKNAIEKKS